MPSTPHEEATQKLELQGKPLSQALWPVVLLTGIFFLNFIARQLAGPSLPEIEAELGLRHAQSGLFILLMGIGFCISQIGAAFLAARWGYKRCILLSLWGSAAAALAVANSATIWSLYASFLLLGMAGGLYVPSGIALITVLVRSQDWGKGLGIHELAPNLALIAVPFMATIAVVFGSWRLGYISIACILALLGIIYAKIGADADENPSAPSMSRIREVIGQPFFWQICVLLSLAVGVETGVYAITPLFLVHEKGFLLAEANQILGLSRVPGIILVLISGWLTDRLSPSTAVSIALGLTGSAIVALGGGPDWVVVPAIFLQAAASACLFPPILSMASAVSSHENRALTISLSIAIAPVIGSGLLPAAIAACGDIWTFGVGLVGTGLLICSGIGLVLRHK